MPSPPPAPLADQGPRVAGRATAAGTARYAARHAQRVAAGFYRPLGADLAVGSIGMGGYLGGCDDADDERYAAAARAVQAGQPGQGCYGDATSVITMGHYAAAEVGELPATAQGSSLGCGNPTALIDLRPGEVEHDLGSGGALDVLLSARRVGPGGHAYVPIRKLA